MTEDSLRDVISDFGASSLAAAIADEFNEQLAAERGPAGQPFDDLVDVHHAVRQYDHGQASEKQVSETGVKAVFNPEQTSLSALQEGGCIRRRFYDLAQTHLERGVDYIDIAYVTDDRYVVWIIADTDELI